jgi:hypothetical protein
LGLIAALLSAAAAFITAYFVVPDRIADGKVDLSACHACERRRYLLAFIGYSLSVLVMNSFVLPGSTPSVLSVVYVIPNLGLLSLALLTDNRWIQRSAPVAILLIDAIYFTRFFSVIS